MPLNPDDGHAESLPGMNPPPLAGEAKKKPAARGFGLFFRKREPVAFTAQAPESRRSRRSDLTVAALGITLGLICAMFPWYIFLNQDEFGPPSIKFDGNGQLNPSGPITLGPMPERVGAPLTVEDIPALELDLFATGTTPAPGEADDEEGTKGLTEQPFPADPMPFKLVHIANGRAMIEDDTGLFIVQRGSVLPDSSVVASIEQRAGRWVLVTSTDEVLTPTE